MSVAIKLLILALLNLAAMFYMLNKLISRGNNLTDALRLAWDLVLGQSQVYMDTHLHSSFIWIPILRKTWWLMIAAYVVSWFISEDLWMTIGIVLLIVIHVLWYLFASLTLKTKYDRILNLTADWGIVYKEIGMGSFLAQKSLAELDLRKKNLLVLAIERNNKLNPFPKGLEIIQMGDRVVMFGDLDAFRTGSW
jgi:hypothetical protein